jgi:alpha-ketoglutarate-dependent taurine dioxygenase
MIQTRDTLTGLLDDNKRQKMQDITGLKQQDLGIISGKKMLVNAELGDGNEKQWVAKNADTIDRLLNENGALLIRGLKLKGSKKIGTLLTGLFKAELLEYNFRSTPRTQMRGNVYTSSEYHAKETIVQHNEAAYSNSWPMRLGLGCLDAPDTGGQTPISDSHEVFKLIPDAVVARFEKDGLMYVRNYAEVDLPWTEVFQTTKKEEVEDYCAKNDIHFEWLEDGTLRTKQTNQATMVHPVSGKKIWFNQAHLFHVSALEKSNREDLLNIFGEDKLPRNVYYGDGTAIEYEVLDNIRTIYEEQQIAFDWQENDLLLIDNMLYTHGRNPYTGSRKILVGMTRSHGK